MKTRSLLVLGALSAVALAGCGDDPFAFPWEASPDTVRLFALSQPRHNLPSAIDFRVRRTVRVEAAATEGQWDLAMDTTGGRFVWLPPGVLGITSQAAVADLEEDGFAAATEAPADTARYVRNRRMEIREGRVYAVRTRRHVGAFGGASCSYYGKIQAIALDLGEATARFQYDLSPACNNRALVPPD